MPGEMRQSVADPGPALAVAAEAERRLHQRAWAAEEDVDRLTGTEAVMSGQLGLGVEGIHRARATLHE